MHRKFGLPKIVVTDAELGIEKKKKDIIIEV